LNNGDNEDSEDSDKEEEPALKKSRLALRAEKILEKEYTKTEYGMHRGIDFTDVSWVVNFDPSTDPGIYVHRIGRTGRGGKEGKAISFFTGDEETEVLDIVMEDQKAREHDITEYPKTAFHYEKLRVRVDDVLCGISNVAVKRARVTELAREILVSEKLKAHFKDDPGDLRSLTHLASARPKRMMFAASYIHDIPTYMGFDVKSAPQLAIDEHKRKVLAWREREKRLRITDAQMKHLDPLKKSDYVKALEVEKRLTKADIAILDPGNAHRILAGQERAHKRKLKEWKRKSGGKRKRTHNRKALRYPR
jgi:ATP-dependent RNA helicase DDX56/DBP9